MTGGHNEFAKAALKDVTFGSFWLDAPQRSDVCPPLTSDTQADLLIVGGGFTGLWAAIQAKEADPARIIALIEAKHVGFGASGRPGAIVSTSLMHDLGNIERTFPQDQNDLTKLGTDNLEAMIADIKRLGIDCDFHHGGELNVALDDSGMPELEEEYARKVKYGQEAEMLTREEVQAQVNSPVFVGGLWSRGLAGTLHPAKLVWGLKAAALKLGVTIHEMTPLNTASKTAKGVQVITPGGRITARKVLLATNAFAAGHSHIKRRVTTVIDRVIATHPLTDEQRAKIGWENRQGIYDNRAQLNYMRMTADNRIIFGGRLTYRYGNNPDTSLDETVEPFERLAEAFLTTFPQLDNVTFSHAWSGPIGLTTRKAVHFQSYHGGDMVYVGGYSGFGVSSTRFGARIGLAVLDDVDIPERKLAFAQSTPRIIPPEPFRYIGAKITMYALDTADEKGGWRIPWINFVEKFGFPLH